MKTKQCTYCGASGDHNTDRCPWRPGYVDNYTSAHPLRNLLAVIVLVVMADQIANLITW